jgi:hypothetical protein
MFYPPTHGTESYLAKSMRRRLRWLANNNAAVAQRIRASVYGTEGREFESLQPHHPHHQLGPG